MPARHTTTPSIAAALLAAVLLVLALGPGLRPAAAAPAGAHRGGWFAAATGAVEQQVQLVARLRAEQRAKLAALAVAITTPPPPPPPPSVDDPSTFLFPARGPITSSFGPRWGRQHTGVDIDGPTGSPIIAAQAGTVTLAGWKNGYGITVIIDHGNGVSTLYAHQARLAVHTGQTVQRGQMLGTVGATGNVTAAHLHYEVHVNGVPRNPRPWL